MDKYLNTPIRTVIAEFPEVGSILEDYSVGCVNCQVGTCLLKDVVSIHDLPPEDERALMAKIAGVVTPGAKVELSVPTRTFSGQDSRKRELKYSPPIRQLVDEHVLIKRWVALIPRLLETVDVGRAEDRQLLLGGVDFIRSYADRFHHAKEEQILFAYFDPTQEIIQAMLADHETARAHVRRLAEALAEHDADAVAEQLGAYGELLSAHIKREDEILYPWMDRQLTTSQVGELFSRFAAVDRAAGEGFTERYASFVTRVARQVESAEPQAREIAVTRIEVTT
jgi:hemerythrin-like domain-containing protein